MEMNIVENRKSKLILEIKGTDHTICNSLKGELYNDEHVKVSTYSIKHPLITTPKVIVETDNEETPKNALSGAIARLKKNNERFKKEFLKDIK